MRPGLRRTVVRERTSYSMGRVVVNAIFWVEVAGVLGGVLLIIAPGALGVAKAFIGEPPDVNTAVFGYALVIMLSLGAVAALLLAILKREFLLAFFDIADANLEQVEMNPFKEA